jgi:uncharacterized protein (TIGR02598 family)
MSTIKPTQNEAAFTLVEVTIAIGLAAFCLIALFGLLPQSVQSSSQASAETLAIHGATGIIADLKATPATATESPLHQLPLTSGTFYFTSAWQKVTSASGAHYRLVTKATVPGASSPEPVRSTLQVSWPATATTIQAAAGSITLFTAFNRE